MKLKLVAEKLGADLVGDGDLEIVKVSTIDGASENDLTFLANARYAHFLESTKAGAIIVAAPPEASKHNLLVHPDPYFAFSQALTLFYPPPGSQLPVSTAPTAAIAPTATLGSSLHIGNFVEIGDGASIGDHSKIMAGCFVGAHCRIGKNCLIYPHVTICDRCVIGDNVTIHAGTAVGSDGFGYAFHDGVHNKIYQLGIVRIEDNVEIGSNCSIDRAALGETVVGEGTKVDNLVQIAHNVKIGRRCIIISQVGISGSVKLGEYVTIAGQVGLVGHIEIGDRAIVIAQAGVPKSLKGDMIYAGSPAREFKEFKRIEAHLRHLPERADQIRKLEDEVAELKRRLDEIERP
jgi:UDP-3-O-[3-hydroxymyristoyl] glucosamine N-acyltransferase